MTFFSLISNKKDFHLLKEEADKALVGFQNIGRNGNNEDVDNSIVFLLSGKATLVTIHLENSWWCECREK
jgi:hypothetical protein